MDFCILVGHVGIQAKTELKEALYLLGEKKNLIVRKKKCLSKACFLKHALVWSVQALQKRRYSQCLPVFGLVLLVLCYYSRPWAVAVSDM